MARIDNSKLAGAIRTVVSGAQANGQTWAVAKALITPENEADAAAVLAADATFVATATAEAKAPKVKELAPEGTLRRAIQDYVPAAKDATFTKANGEVVACTAKQKAAWEAGRERFVAAAPVKAAPVAEPVVVTQSTTADDVAKLLADPEALTKLLTALLSK